MRSSIIGGWRSPALNPPGIARLGPRRINALSTESLSSQSLETQEEPLAATAKAHHRRVQLRFNLARCVGKHGSIMTSDWPDRQL
jgi:hypothetical protein